MVRNASLLTDFDALAINRSHAGLRFSSQGLAQVKNQDIVEPVEDPGPFPFSEAVKDGTVRGKVVREHAPLTAGAIQIEQGVEDLPQRIGAASAARVTRQVRCDP